MRPQSDMPRPPRRSRRQRRERRPGRARVILLVGAVLLFVLITSLRGIAGFYTDYLWFDSLKLTSVWRTLLGAKAAMTIIFILTFFVLAWVNLFIAERVAPRFPPTGPQEELVQRYRDLVGGHAMLVRSGVALLFALIVGAGTQDKWQDWILFTHRVDFGQTDATFHTDIGFYVFQLPFLTFLAGWLFTAVLVVLVLSVVAHYLNGGIRAQGIQRVTPQVKAHVSVLLACLALIKAAQYWLQRYELTFSTRGTVDGATYTDVNVQTNVIYLLVIISLFAFALFLVNIFRRGWVLPVLAVGLWALVAILAGQLVPAFVQRFRVEPAESAKEAPYISQNIQATRKAIGLDKVADNDFAANGQLDAAALLDNAATVRNIRLWDPAQNITGTDYQQTQGLRAFYDIKDVDVDRYPLQSDQTQVMIAARDLLQSGIPQSSWEAQHLLYTHGYGAVISPANAKEADGAPKLVVRDAPVVSDPGAPVITEPRIYIGEGQSSYVIVGTGRQEINYPAGDKTETTSYDGADGIRIGSGVGGFMRKAAFSLRFGDPNPLISSNIQARSRILMERNARERVKTLAPFLAFDHDPYLVAVDGRLKWVVDGYTTTNRYPNAQRVSTVGVDQSSDLAGRDFNYARNSVKAVVDAYDGNVDLYVVDEGDPMIRSYRKAFPELFTNGDQIPPEIRDHFRYPEDLFTVQTTMWGRYHVDQPQSFYENQDTWSVASNPGTGSSEQDAGPATTAVAAPTEGTDGRSKPIPAYYQLMRLPNETKESFLILRPFVPSSSQSTSAQPLRSFMVAKSGPENYGQLETFVMPPSGGPPGPEVAANQIQADPQVSESQTFFGRQGSEVILGNLILVPIDQTTIYVRPFYVQGQGDIKVPLLKRVIVAYQDQNEQFRVAINDTLGGALTELFGFAPNTQEETPTPNPANPPGDGNTPPTTNPGNGVLDQAQLISDLNQALTDADNALKSGNLAAYQVAVGRATDLARQLQAGAPLNPSSPPATAPGTTTTVPVPGAALPGTPATASPPTTSVPPTTVPPSTTAPPTTAAAASGL